MNPRQRHSSHKRNPRPVLASSLAPEVDQSTSSLRASPASWISTFDPHLRRRLTSGARCKTDCYSSRKGENGVTVRNRYNTEPKPNLWRASWSPNSITSAVRLYTPPCLYVMQPFCLLQPSCTSKFRRSTFTSLDEGTRSTILEEPVGEIVLMLEQNLLSKFKLTPAMQQREQRKLVDIGE